MLWDLGLRKIVVKVVYYGCAMSGKTTSLRYIFKKFGREDVLQSIETRAGRTLFFDWGSIFVEKGQWHFQIDLWSATGQNFYAETRPTVLSGVDGIVFVADSQKHLIKDNLASWNELSLLMGNLKKTIPVIVSLNKRDSPNAISDTEFKNVLGLKDATNLFETIATQGINILECFKKILQKIFDNS